MRAIPAILLAACVVGCRTKAEFGDGSKVVLSGRADEVKVTTPGGSIEIAGLSHAEETRAAGEMAERIVKPIARAATWRKLFGALENVGVAALDQAAEVNADDNALRATEAALEAETAIETAP